jgi:hypothetical protein
VNQYIDIDIDVHAILSVQRDAIVRWKALPEINFIAENFLALVEKNHAFNYQLWHAEDKARREDKGYEFVYHAKRAIDGFNQQRNDCMEAMDDWLTNALTPASPEQCAVHSETPGMMIDRLSILALKHYHMEAQVKREDVDDAHRHACASKLRIIDAQQQQLARCLDVLLQETKRKIRTFRTYRQCKMYNDAALNPELY